MSFFKTLLATVIGFFLAWILLFLLMIGIVASSSSETEPFIRNGTVLRIQLNGPVGERRVEDPFMEAFDSGSASRLTMDTFRSNLRKAKNDTRIAGIWLDLGNLSASWTHLAEMRTLLQEFSATGKFIYSYGGDLGINEAAFFVATVSDSIFAQPDTYLETDGFYLEGQFYKRAFEKFGLKADVIAAGTYKSAGDSYTNERFSSADREQLSEILRHFSDQYALALANYSGYDVEEVHGFMDAPPTMLISAGLERGFIDGLMYPGEFEALLKEKTGQSSLQSVTFNRYRRVSDSSAGVTVPRNASQIAVIHADGMIMPDIGGELFPGSNQNLTYAKMKEAFDKVSDDPKVAAIVLRINSPGGAMSTSELIRDLVAQAATKKPVVASMGAVAASGGYYIAMGADTVMAESNTITGSIGVILMKLSYGELMAETLGISRDVIRTHAHADWMSPAVSLSAVQRRSLEGMADEAYDRFLGLVADGRGREKSDIHQYAQGRVWTGQAALEIGLIDVLGTLNDATNLAAQMAGIDAFTVAVYPVQKPFIETLFESGNTRIRSLVQQTLGLNVNPDAQLQKLRLLERPQLYSILPLEFSVN